MPSFFHNLLGDTSGEGDHAGQMSIAVAIVEWRWRASHRSRRTLWLMRARWSLSVERVVAYKKDKSSSSATTFRSFSCCDTPVGTYV